MKFHKFVLHLQIFTQSQLTHCPFLPEVSCCQFWSKLTIDNCQDLLLFGHLFGDTFN